MQLHSAALLLSDAGVATVTDLAGSITTSDAHGYTRLMFSAADPDGPGGSTSQGS